MNKHLPISLTKYERFLRKMPKHFFPNKNLISFYNNYSNKDVPLFGTEIHHRTTSGFKNYVTQRQSYDKKQLLGLIDKNYVAEIIQKFIAFPKLPKTYLKRKDCNYYKYNSHVSTFVETSLNLKTLKEASKDKDLIPALNEALKNYSVFMSAFERNYYFAKGPESLNNIFYFINDETNVVNLKKLIDDLPNNLPFLASISRATSIVSLESAADLSDTYYFDPLRWKDNYRESKTYFDTILHTASKNAMLAQTAVIIKLQTLNYDFLQYSSQRIANTYKQTNPDFFDKYKNYWLNEKFSGSKPNNDIYLKYFFYEFIDYEEYI